MEPPSKPVVNMSYTQEEWQALSHSIADVLCWFQGFGAGGGITGDIDTETLRKFNRDLKCRILP